MLAHMSREQQLKGLARTPLWLDVMAVAYGGVDATIAPETVATSDIFDAYIRRVMFEHRQPVAGWSPGQCMHWLRWLAQATRTNGAIAVPIGEMQPEWLVGQLSGVGTIGGWMGNAVVVAMIVSWLARLGTGLSSHSYRAGCWRLCCSNGAECRTA